MDLIAAPFVVFFCRCFALVLISRQVESLGTPRAVTLFITSSGIPRVEGGDGCQTRQEGLPVAAPWWSSSFSLLSVLGFP